MDDEIDRLLAGRRADAGSFVLEGDALKVMGLNPIGVLWGLGAAVCLCGYFVLSEENDNTPAVAPLMLTTVGTGGGGLVILAIGALHILPMHARLVDTSLAGMAVAWWLPLTLLVLVSGAFAYLSGIIAVRRLGSSIASFVSLSEVIFAVVFAIFLLGQHPSLSQLIGGILVLGGIAAVQRAAR